MYDHIFDSHSHYDAQEFDCDRDQLLGSLPEQGVIAVMAAADTLESSKRGKELSERYHYIYCSAGIHPHDAKNAPVDLEDQLREFAKNPKMRAIGEIGLDYHYDFSPRDVQRSVLCRQLELAKALDLPVILHDREAHEDMYAILNEYRPKGIMHSYSGSVESAEMLLDLGFYLGFSGVVTFKNAKKPVEVARMVPLDRMLMETDCPYLAPEPYRGKRSDSTMIVATAGKIAEIRQQDVQEILSQTCTNACTVFGIDCNSLEKKQKHAVK